jgi:hypothetical protein
MKSFCTIALNDKHYIIAYIHPNLGNRHYRVACIKELVTSIENRQQWQ